MFSDRWLKKTTIPAVHDYQLEDFLSSIGLLEQVLNGHATCSICNTGLSLENLGVVYPRNNMLTLACDSDTCIAIVLEKEGTDHG